MIDLIRYTPAHNVVWDAFVQEAKNGIFMFYRGYMDYHAERFVDYSLMFYEDGALIALLPMNIREGALYSHGGLTFGGFIVNTKMKAQRMIECGEALIQHMSFHRIQKLIYKALPYIYFQMPAQEDLFFLSLYQARLVRTDISTTIDFQHRLALPKGRKASINKAKREGIEIQESLDYEAFFEMENQRLQEKYGVSAVHTAEEMQSLHAKFPDHITLYLARLGDKTLAGAVFFVYNELVHTQYMTTSSLGRELGALDLLLDTCIRMYSPHRRYFDFGISNDPQDRSLNQGLIAQKESFGGRAIIHQQWELLL